MNNSSVSQVKAILIENCHASQGRQFAYSVGSRKSAVRQATRIVKHDIANKIHIQIWITGTCNEIENPLWHLSAACQRGSKRVDQNLLRSREVIKPWRAGIGYWSERANRERYFHIPNAAAPDGANILNASVCGPIDVIGRSLQVQGNLPFYSYRATGFWL